MPTQIYDLPVYRLKQDVYYKDREDWLEKHLPDSEFMREYYAKNPERRIHAKQHADDASWGPWDFNEIIGYVRLHIVGTQIRGEYWCHEAKRYTRTRRKIFKWQSNKLVTEMNLPVASTNRAIGMVIDDYIEACSQELPGRYIDSARFEAISPHMNWKSLIRQAN